MTEPIIHLIKEYQQATDKDAREEMIKLIFHILRPQLLRLTFKLYSLDDFEDFEMEAMQAVVTRLDSFRGRSDGEFYSLFNAVAWGKCVDKNRKEERRRKLFKPLPTEDTQEILDQFAKIDPPSHELKLDLEEALKELDKTKPECRKLLWNNIVVGVKQVQIAKMLGEEPSAVRMRINRCKDKLAEILGSQNE